MRLLLVVFVVALLCGGALSDGFVRRSGTRFIDDECKEVMYVGWNRYPSTVALQRD